jgi:hypothetical protein
LYALIEHPEDPWLRTGAHHVLSAFVNEPLLGVLAAMDGPVPSLETPLAAFRALDQLSDRPVMAWQRAH